MIHSRCFTNFSINSIDLYFKLCWDLGGSGNYVESQNRKWPEINIRKLTSPPVILFYLNYIITSFKLGKSSFFNICPQI